jgi:hypothetical protein
MPKFTTQTGCHKIPYKQPSKILARPKAKEEEEEGGGGKKKKKKKDTLQLHTEKQL